LRRLHPPRFHPPFLWSGMESTPAARPVTIDCSAATDLSRRCLPSRHPFQRTGAPTMEVRAFLVLQPMSTGPHDGEVGACQQAFIFSSSVEEDTGKYPVATERRAAVVARACSFASHMRRPPTGRAVLANVPAAPSPTVWAPCAPQRANARHELWLLSAPTHIAQRAATVTWRQPRLLFKRALGPSGNSDHSPRRCRVKGRSPTLLVM